MCDFSRDGHSSVSTQTASCMWSCVSRCTTVLQYQGRRHGAGRAGHAMAHPSLTVGWPHVFLAHLHLMCVWYTAWVYRWRFITVSSVRHGLSAWYAGIFCTTKHIIKLFSRTLLRYVRLMAWAVRPSVCRSVCMYVCMPVCLSLCPSVVCLWRSSSKFRGLNTIFAASNSLGTPVVCIKILRKKSKGSTWPCSGDEKLGLSANIPLYFENGTRYDIIVVTTEDEQELICDLSLPLSCLDII